MLSGKSANANEKVTALNCGHTFHFGCVRPLYKNYQLECPNCREPQNNVPAPLMIDTDEKDYFDGGRGGPTVANQIQNLSIQLSRALATVNTLKVNLPEKRSSTNQTTKCVPCNREFKRWEDFENHFVEAH